MIVDYLAKLQQIQTRFNFSGNSYRILFGPKHLAFDLCALGSNPKVRGEEKFFFVILPKEKNEKGHNFTYNKLLR